MFEKKLKEICEQGTEFLDPLIAKTTLRKIAPIKLNKFKVRKSRVFFFNRSVKVLKGKCNVNANLYYKSKRKYFAKVVKRCKNLVQKRKKKLASRKGSRKKLLYLKLLKRLGHVNKKLVRQPKEYSENEDGVDEEYLKSKIKSAFDSNSTFELKFKKNLYIYLKTRNIPLYSTLHYPVTTFVSKRFGLPLHRTLDYPFYIDDLLPLGKVLDIQVVFDVNQEKAYRITLDGVFTYYLSSEEFLKHVFNETFFTILRKRYRRLRSLFKRAFRRKQISKALSYLPIMDSKFPRYFEKNYYDLYLTKYFDLFGVSAEKREVNKYTSELINIKEKQHSNLIKKYFFADLDYFLETLDLPKTENSGKIVVKKKKLKPKKDSWKEEMRKAKAKISLTEAAFGESAYEEDKIRREIMESIDEGEDSGADNSNKKYKKVRKFKKDKKFKDRHTSFKSEEYTSTKGEE